MGSDVVFFEVFMTERGLSRTGIMGAMRASCSWGIRGAPFPPWREYQQSASWMIFAASVFVFVARVSLSRPATLTLMVRD